MADFQKKSNLPGLSQEENSTSGIVSPCIQVCTMNDVTGFCYGCGRTRVEIARWLSFTNGERKKIMHLLDGRKRKG